ncbi:MAG: SBBP repeat-containing protein [Bacteroidales bacterium]
MKKTITILLLISLHACLANSVFSQSPYWSWARKMAISDNHPSATAVDSMGNIFVTGYYNGSITFGSTVLTSLGNTDIYLVKYDAYGGFQWARSAGGTNNDRPACIKLDGLGNIYLAGCFISPVITFGNISLTNVWSYDAFIVKYDAGGNAVWARRAGENGGDYASDLVVSDVNGDIYLAGYFDSDSITFGSFTLNNTGDYDIFLAKYDQNGNVIWARSATGEDADLAISIDLDPSGNLLVAGYFGMYAPNSLTIDSITLIGDTLSDIFMAKFNTQGEVMWAKVFGGSNEDELADMKSDISGNIFLTGIYGTDPIFFDTVTLFNQGRADIFLAKLNNNGDVIWAERAGGTDTDIVYSLAIDSSGNSYITGDFQSPVISFDTTAISLSGMRSIFLAEYDSGGNLAWAKSAGGNLQKFSYSVATDPQGNPHITGAYTGTSITFGNITLNNIGLFLAKLCHTAPAVPVITASDTALCQGQSVTFWASYAPAYLWNTGASTQSITVNQAGDYYVQIYTALGCTNISATFHLPVTPPIPVIQQVSNYLVSSSPDNNQWYVNNNILPADTNPICYPVIQGNYKVVVTDSNGCSSASLPLWCVGLDEISNSDPIILYPNPMNNLLNLETDPGSRIEIADLKGQVVKSLFSTSKKLSVEVTELSGGMYILKMISPKRTRVCRFIKQQ